ncbi:MAG: Rieske 2Fe-2S domain-containing protein [Deltaproteobacteria bacterium]|nr:Rieske 2Fe-2S domain-containing protein [Deltaproteobacteria bacterium]
MEEAGEPHLEPAGQTGDHLWSRRSLLALTGWGAVFGGLAVALAAFVRFLFPRVLFEPPSTFKAGFPAEYRVGTVSERFKEREQVWIARNEEGFYALLAVCTHLGCTPRWQASDARFRCPCHGSGFHRDGSNFEGPAPRPLERVRISLADDGQLLVDRARRYRHELGEWGEEGAFLPYREGQG